MKQDPDNRPMLAQRMLQERLQGMTTAAIVRASGINTVTIGNIAKGKALRVTDRVYASIGDAYEQLKELTRGKGGIDPESLQQFIAGLAIPEADKALLRQLTPATYIGIAQKLASEI